MVLAGLVGCQSGADNPPSPPANSQSGSGQVTADSTGTGDGSESDSESESDDGTGGTPPPTDFNYAFVSSEAILPGDLGGLDGADQFCQDLADGAGLGGTYVAWLSTNTTDAKNRLAGARNWVRVDGRPFAAAVGDLTAGGVMYPLRVDETGADAPDERVMTATDATGIKINDSEFGSCQNWTSSNPNTKTSGGVSDSGDETWTAWPGLELNCGTAYRIYCLGKDNDEAMDFTPTEGRLAFISDSTFASNVGLDLADTQCQQEATNAGVAGQFAALLATEAESAAARFDLAGLIWVRPDGIPLMDDAADLGTGVLAPVALDAEGFVVAPRHTWTGAIDPGSTSSGESCVSWSGQVGAARVGLSGRSSTAWFSTDVFDCSGLRHVYCFEQ